MAKKGFSSIIQKYITEFLSILGVLSTEVHRKLWNLKADHRTLNGQPYIFLPVHLITLTKLCIQSTLPHIQCVPVIQVNVMLNYAQGQLYLTDLQTNYF